MSTRRAGGRKRPSAVLAAGPADIDVLSAKAVKERQARIRRERDAWIRALAANRRAQELCSEELSAKRLELSRLRLASLAFEEHRPPVPADRESTAWASTFSTPSLQLEYGSPPPDEETVNVLQSSALFPTPARSDVKWTMSRQRALAALGNTSLRLQRKRPREDETIDESDVHCTSIAEMPTVAVGFWNIVAEYTNMACGGRQNVHPGSEERLYSTVDCFLQYEGGMQEVLPRWSPDEDRQLLEHGSTSPSCDWEVVASLLCGPRRSPFHCLQRYLTMVGRRRVCQLIDPSGDELDIHDVITRLSSGHCGDWNLTALALVERYGWEHRLSPFAMQTMLAKFQRDKDPRCPSALQLLHACLLLAAMTKLSERNLRQSLTTALKANFANLFPNDAAHLNAVVGDALHLRAFDSAEHNAGSAYRRTIPLVAVKLDASINLDVEDQEIVWPPELDSMLLEATKAGSTIWEKLALEVAVQFPPRIGCMLTPSVCCSRFIDLRQRKSKAAMTVEQIMAASSRAKKRKRRLVPLDSAMTLKGDRTGSAAGASLVQYSAWYKRPSQWKPTTRDGTVSPFQARLIPSSVTPWSFRFLPESVDQLPSALRSLVDGGLDDDDELSDSAEGEDESNSLVDLVEMGPRQVVPARWVESPIQPLNVEPVPALGSGPQVQKAFRLLLSTVFGSKNDQEATSMDDLCRQYSANQRYTGKEHPHSKEVVIAAVSLYGTQSVG